MIVLLDVPKGHELLIGAPSKPMPVDSVNLILKCVRGFQEIEEVHLPQVFIEGVMDAPRQVLVILIENLDSCSDVLGRLSTLLESVIPNDEHLDVWPIANESSLARAIRNANCQVGI